MLDKDQATLLKTEAFFIQCRAQNLSEYIDSLTEPAAEPAARKFGEGITVSDGVREWTLDEWLKIVPCPVCNRVTGYECCPAPTVTEPAPSGMGWCVQCGEWVKPHWDNPRRHSIIDGRGELQVHELRTIITTPEGDGYFKCSICGGDCNGDGFLQDGQRCYSYNEAYGDRCPGKYWWHPLLDSKPPTAGEQQRRWENKAVVASKPEPATPPTVRCDVCGFLRETLKYEGHKCWMHGCPGHYRRPHVERGPERRYHDWAKPGLNRRTTNRRVMGHRHVHAPVAPKESARNIPERRTGELWVAGESDRCGGCGYKFAHKWEQARYFCCQCNKTVVVIEERVRTTDRRAAEPVAVSKAEKRADAFAKLEEGCSVTAGSLLPETFEQQVEENRRAAEPVVAHTSDDAAIIIAALRQRVSDLEAGLRDACSGWESWLSSSRAATDCIDRKSIAKLRRLADGTAKEAGPVERFNPADFTRDAVRRG